mmetsp:Transcript_7775/g.19308  ORF Transcript_7775/g.19308 Transcript_7775/m.19308 type:complete len:250 (-) Transcript_7775:420-1169(-)
MTWPPGTCWTLTCVALAATGALALAAAGSTVVVVVVCSTVASLTCPWPSGTATVCFSVSLAVFLTSVVGRRMCRFFLASAAEMAAPIPTLVAAAASEPYLCPTTCVVASDRQRSTCSPASSRASHTSLTAPRLALPTTRMPSPSTRPLFTRVSAGLIALATWPATDTAAPATLCATFPVTCAAPAAAACTCSRRCMVAGLTRTDWVAGASFCVASCAPACSPLPATCAPHLSPELSSAPPCATPWATLS